MNRERTRSTDPVGHGSDWHELIEGEGSCLIDQNPAQPGDNTITLEITAQVCAQQHPSQLQWAGGEMSADSQSGATQPLSISDKIESGRIEQLIWVQLDLTR